MDKVDLTKQFANRLKEAMLAAGFNSSRSTSGVCIHKLAEITGYSIQICRKYLRGEAIPEPVKLQEVAEKLRVSPGWLLFGESEHDAHLSEDFIMIRKKLLRYILDSASPLYANVKFHKKLPNFLMDLINDVAHIHTDEEQYIKIINLAMASTTHFQE